MMQTLPHILSIDQFDKKRIVKLLSDAELIENALKKRQHFNVLSGKILATLFFEASTRTRFSFATAMLRLGGEVINFPLHETRAGANWKESLSDTARMINGYADLVVIRHPEVNSLNDYVAASEIPIINAGNGWREKGAEHPTQALLDLYTIKKELGFLEGRKILLIGDMNARVIRSLIKVFGRFPSIKLYLLSPDRHWISRQDEEEYCNSKIYYQRIHSLDDVLEEVDVIYQNGVSEKRTDPVPESIRLTQKKLQRIKNEAIILHSFPRAEEMANDVDNLPQAKYFIQARNAVPIRMALLAQIVDHQIDLVDGA